LDRTQSLRRAGRRQNGIAWARPVASTISLYRMPYANRKPKTFE
jgi:hypothetical protein